MLECIFVTKNSRGPYRKRDSRLREAANTDTGPRALRVENSLAVEAVAQLGALISVAPDHAARSVPPFITLGDTHETFEQGLNGIVQVYRLDKERHRAQDHSLSLARLKDLANALQNVRSALGQEGEQYGLRKALELADAELDFYGITRGIERLARASEHAAGKVSKQAMVRKPKFPDLDGLAFNLMRLYEAHTEKHFRMQPGPGVEAEPLERRFVRQAMQAIEPGAETDTADLMIDDAFGRLLDQRVNPLP